MIEDPLPKNDVWGGGGGYQILGVVLQEGNILFLCSNPPIRIDKGAAGGLRDR